MKSRHPKIGGTSEPNQSEIDGEKFAAIARMFLGDPAPEAGSQVLNAQVAMILATNAVFSGGLRESLIALLRSQHEIAPYIRNQLADALERGASQANPDQYRLGEPTWRLAISGFGDGSGTKNNVGEQVRTRRRRGNIGQFMRELISHGDSKVGRQDAMKEASTKFGVSEQSADKALSYFDARERWIDERRTIEPFSSELPSELARELDRLEYDGLHVKGAAALDRRIEQIRVMLRGD